MFVYSSAAASLCEIPDEIELSNFLQNYQMVTIRTNQALESKFPNHTKKQLQNAIKKKVQFITGLVKNTVSTKGCKDKKIVDILKKYHMHAKWEPYKK